MNDGLKDKHRQAIIDILAANSRVKRVALFGSRAMGTFSTTSDVDLALYGDELTLTDQAKLAASIDDLPIAQRVDLLIYKSLDNDNLKKHIRKYGIEWFRQGWERSTDWPSYKVADLEKKKQLLVQDGNHGEYRPRKTEFVNIGVSFIRAADLGNGAVQFDTATKINKIAFNRIRKGIGTDLDSILSTKGTVGKLSFVPISSPKFVCSPQTSFWRSLDHQFIDPKFLYYELQSKHFRDQINSRKGETDMADYLSLTSQRGLTIRVPEIETQKKITTILGTIDNKIELNRQINQTLEQIAQAMFKSWFVDFEPVKAKIAAKENGQDPERAAMCAISGKSDAELNQLPADQLSQLATTAAIFPDELVDSELGLIPRGWAVKPLDEIAHYQNGLALQKFRPENEDDFLPIVKIAQLKKGTANSDEKASQNINPACIIDNGDIIFSWSGSLMVDLWCGGKAALNQHLFKVTSDSFQKWFYYFWTKHHLASFQQFAADKAVTMGHIKRSHLKEALCTIPNINFEFFDLIDNLLSQQIKLRLECVTLTQLRDTLLPKLLSGEITVAETQAKIEEAV